jgi:hypothetical protein
MSVESYRAEAASQQHLPSARPKKASSKHAPVLETVASLSHSGASSAIPSQPSRQNTSAGFLLTDTTSTHPSGTEKTDGETGEVSIPSAGLIDADSTV